MGYTVSWHQLQFSEFTYQSVLRLIRKMIHPSTTMWPQEGGFAIGASQYDRASIQRNHPYIGFVKTNRLPYTKEFMKALILMVEFGAAEDLRHDDSDQTLFLEALDEVNAVHALASYEQQKAYFNSFYESDAEH